MNPYNIGVGGFVVTSLYVVILAFFWRVLAAKFANSSSPFLAGLGSAMGSTL